MVPGGGATAGPTRRPTLTILGSGTLVPDEHHHGAAHLIHSASALVLMDCGHGTIDGVARYGVAWRDLTHVLITHFHPDHVADLGPLLQALRYGTRPRRNRPLHLVGPTGFGAFLERLAAAMLPGLLEPGFPLRVVEVASDRAFEDEGAALRISCAGTPHTPESVAYRVSVSGSTVGYTGDTGPSEAVASFLAGCDVLVAECTQPDPPELETHLSPSSLTALAAVAGPRVLVVTHVAPPSLPREVAAAVAEGWGGTVVAAHDGLVVPLL